MDRQTHFPREVRLAVIGFLSLMAVVIAIGFAKAAGLVNVAVEQRVLGIVIEATIVVHFNSKVFK